MKLLEILRFELSYQLRRPWPWLIFAALVIFAFLFTRDGSLAQALYEDFFLNSPFVILGATVAASPIWLLVGAVIAGEAAARDVATGMHPLVYTLPIARRHYLGGRFLAALVLNALILLAVPIGNLLAVYSPGIHPEVVGPFRPAAYLTAYAFIALPNAFVATAIQFSLGARTGQPMTGYLGSMFVFSMSYVVGLFLVIQGRPDLANLLDPIGVHFILSELARLWTPVERATRLLDLEGVVLTNRLLWLGIALVALAVTYLTFRFAHRTTSTLFGWLRSFAPRRWKHGTAFETAHVPALAAIGVTASAPISVPRVSRTFGLPLHARQALAIAWDSFRALATSWAGLALLLAIPLMTVPVVVDQMVSEGVRLLPTTVLVLGELTAPLSAELSRWVIVPLLVVFFAGELVWRERDAGLGEITDAMPGSEWAPFLGKFLGLGLVLVLFTALQMAAGMLAQLLMGYTAFDIGLYLVALFGLQLPEYLLFALLALVVHVLVDQKYVGHLAAILVYVIIILAPMFGIEHNLLIYGAGPAWSYTEMRGFGASLAPWLWFKLYWAAWALLFAVVARLLWVRGKEDRLRMRLSLARRRFTRPTAWTAAVALALILTLGGFIFYNTNVLNDYLPASAVAGQRAEYERRYGQYEAIPQPRLAATSLHVEIYPRQRQAEIRGSYRLVNDVGVAIDAIHVATATGGVQTAAVALDRPAMPELVDDKLGHRIYALEEPLQPGEALSLDFELNYAPRGFGESGADASVVANGAYFTNSWLPAIGYQPSRELILAADRRAHELPPRPLIASLYEVEAREHAGSGIAFEAVMGTEEDQVAVAPGALRRAWTEGGRRYFHYATSAPIGDEWAFFSANYAVREAQWNPSSGAGQPVTIRIFHHPQHTTNVESMLRSVRASLDYYTAQFGPYPFDHISLVERPGNGTGLHADASMITFTEGAALWRPPDDPESLDFPFAVVAHEVAHQWTVPYAFVEGAPVLSEGVAWYYAMGVVEETYGRDGLHRLLSFMRRPFPYPPIRRGEPLLRGLDPYLSYRRGPFALHALSEYIGEKRVNQALRRLVEKHRAPDAPLATMLDLYRELQAVTPDAFQYLLHDLFEVNAFWELATERATAEQTAEGAWQVTLEVRARKIVVDEAGVETEVPMDELVEIGVFAPIEEGGELGEPLYAEMNRLHSGAQTITLTVPRRPALAGIDPYHLLDWEEHEDDDNIEGVEVER